MGKLAPARVSQRDDFVISYRVYTMTWSFHVYMLEGARQFFHHPTSNLLKLTTPS